MKIASTAYVVSCEFVKVSIRLESNIHCYKFHIGVSPFAMLHAFYFCITRTKKSKKQQQRKEELPTKQGQQQLRSGLRSASGLQLKTWVGRACAYSRTCILKGTVVAISSHHLVPCRGKLLLESLLISCVLFHNRLELVFQQGELKGGKVASSIQQVLVELIRKARPEETTSQRNSLSSTETLDLHVISNGNNRWSVHTRCQALATEACRS